MVIKYIGGPQFRQTWNDLYTRPPLLNAYNTQVGFEKPMFGRDKIKLSTHHRTKKVAPGPFSSKPPQATMTRNIIEATVSFVTTTRFMVKIER